MRFPGFIGPSYTMPSVNVDCQRTVNLYPEINALGTGKEREVASLVSTPGLKLKLTLPDAPVRGLWTASNGRLFAAAGQKLYEISSSWVATVRGSLATNSGTVSFTNNETDLILVDGPNGYLYNMSGGVFSQITSPDFYGSPQVTYIDGYFVLIKPSTQQFYYAGPNSTIFDPLDVSSAEGSPDILVGIASTSQSVYLFGSNSIEVFYNSGDGDAPFARMQGAVLDVGVTATYSIQRIGNTLFWLGGDRTGTGIIYQMDGYQFKRISTPSIEGVIRALSSEQIVAATAWTYQQGGHLFYCLNLPGTFSTWVFDASTGFWHERTYLALRSEERHRAECHTVAHGVNLVGDYQNGNIYQLDPDTLTDNGTPISRERTAPHITKGLKFIRHNAFQLDMETGVGLDGVGQGVDPEVMINWSDDGGHTYSNEYWAKAGKIGETKKRVIRRRLGSSRDRVYKVKITDPVKVTLIGAEIDVEEGVS